MMLFGVGYDTDNGVIGQFTIEQRNFDIANWPTSMSELLGVMLRWGRSKITFRGYARQKCQPR